jgi:hypothetical protein
MIFAIVEQWRKTVFWGVRCVAFNQSTSLAIVQPLFAIVRNVHNLFSGGFWVGDFLRAQMGKQIVRKVGKTVFLGLNQFAFK